MGQYYRLILEDVNFIDLFCDYITVENRQYKVFLLILTFSIKLTKRGQTMVEAMSTGFIIKVVFYFSMILIPMGIICHGFIDSFKR